VLIAWNDNQNNHSSASSSERASDCATSDVPAGAQQRTDYNSDHKARIKNEDKAKQSEPTKKQRGQDDGNKQTG
jgi:hypothetical protein